MELRNIITFKKIFELNSFSKAACELGYSQSAVTMQIKQLENELNVRLFDRIGKNINLTEDGKKFLYYANDIITATDNAKHALSNSITPNGELRIGILESVCTAFLPTVLSNYHCLYPNVTTVIKIGTFSELSSMLNSNLVDVIWIFDEPIHSNEWINVFDYQQDIAIISSPNHKLAQASNLQLSDIINEPFILTEKSCSYRTIFENTVLTNGYKLNIFLEIGNTEVIKKFVAANLGLSLLPHFTISEELESEQITMLDVSDFKIKMHGQIFYHKNKWLTPSIKEFIRMVEDNLQYQSTC